MNTELKPAEAGHLTVTEYNQFYKWFADHYNFETEETRNIALDAYKYALEDVSYNARH